MRVSREQAAKNREGIVETAARLFRENGFDGIGLDAVMKEAGLRHGDLSGKPTPLCQLLESLLPERMRRLQNGIVSSFAVTLESALYLISTRVA